MLAGAGTWIEADQAVVRAEPKQAFVVRLDAVYDLARHAGEAGLVLETHRLRRGRAADHAIEAASGHADPQFAMAVNVQRIDGVVAQTAAIAVVAAVVIEAPRLAIEQIEAAADRADPQIAPHILDDRACAPVAERARIFAAVRIARHAPARPFDTRETATEGTHPQVADSILVQRHDAIRRQ